jgi:outer membrane protein assembly factor BamB
VIRKAVACTVSLILVAGLFADDWPQFRGPRRDGVSLEKGLLAEWPADGPKLAWTFDAAGVGYSGPAIVGDRLYMAGGRDESDGLFALDLKGDKPKELWSAKIGPLFTWKGNQWNTGPNATPTVDGDSVYALGGGGDLICVAAADGKERWRLNLPNDLGGEVNPIGGDPNAAPFGWGYASAPLVDGDKLICTPGGPKGLLAALDKKSGKVLWRSKEVQDQAPYASPVIAEVGGVRQIIQVTNLGIYGVAVDDGRLLWSYRREPAYDDVVIATPIVHDNFVFTSVGFQQGCDLIKLVSDGKSIKVLKIMSNKSIQNRDGGMVLVDGHVYGHSENRGWFCMELATGKIAWTERNKLGHGSVTAAGGRLYCCGEESGPVVLLEPSANGWVEKGRLKLPRESDKRKPSGRLWTQPVIANGRLYIRDQELLFAFDLK